MTSPLPSSGRGRSEAESIPILDAAVGSYPLVDER